ncbi:MAG: ExbD/TolR family protein [Planctomycetota bacterium]|jgi:biopolymer transport protein ExbD
MAAKSEHNRQRQFGRLRFQPAGKRGVAIAVNLAPMIDVTFLLLIFFLVSTTFERAEGVFTSPMPNQGAGPQVNLPLEPIVIRLSAPQGDAPGVVIKVDHVGQQPADPGELVSVIKGMHAQPGFDTDTPVAIVSDYDVVWDHVVDVWNAALRAGCTKVAFAEP